MDQARSTRKIEYFDPIPEIEETEVLDENKQAQEPRLISA